MRLGKGILKVVGVAVVLLGMVALVAVAAPAVRGQTLRDRPLAALRSQVLGGSEIGVSVRDVDSADVRREKLSSVVGAVVDEVHTDGPAAKAGFKAGDVVVSFDGEKVRSARSFMRLVQETPAGRDVDAVIVRDAEKLTLKVTPQVSDTPFGLGRALEPLRGLRHLTVPSRLALALPTPNRDAAGLMTLSRGRNRGRLGVGVQDLTGQLGEYFGTKEGALITSVDDETPAKTAGLKAGDIITQINGQTVRDSIDLRRRLAGVSGEVTITIMRDRKELTLKAKI